MCKETFATLAVIKLLRHVTFYNLFINFSLILSML